MVQLTSEVSSMPTISTMNSERKIELMPSQVVKISAVTSATKVETMNTSPWAKFTIPMMPNTIV